MAVAEHSPSNASSLPAFNPGFISVLLLVRLIASIGKIDHGDFGSFVPRGNPVTGGWPQPAAVIG